MFGAKWVLLGLVACITPTAARAAERPLNTPPEGFTAVFDGKTLADWHGRKGTYSPYDEAKLSPDEHARMQAEWDADVPKHWHVDAGVGELISDGQGVHLATQKDYGDMEMWVDYLIEPNGDSGIYLRSVPQVQIWDPANPREVANGAPKGSGALWNNDKDNPGKFPLVKADNPTGEWNTLHIKMLGTRCWIWLNDKQTVNGAILDNFFDHAQPIRPRGPIELQTHHSKLRFRNIYVRDIPADEADADLEKFIGSEGFKSVFNGKDFTGWAGPVDEYEVKDGAIFCQPKKGGTIHTVEEFGDFEVKVQFKLPPGGNNGLAIRYPGEGDTAYVGMCELQILDDTASMYDNVDPRQRCGSIYGVVAAHPGYLRPVGQWNFEHVTVKGHHITVELNGTLITDADVTTVHEFMHGSAHPGLLRTSGSFGFAGHDDPVGFRHIEIKRLD